MIYSQERTRGQRRRDRRIPMTEPGGGPPRDARERGVRSPSRQQLPFAGEKGRRGRSSGSGATSNPRKIPGEDREEHRDRTRRAPSPATHKGRRELIEFRASGFRAMRNRETHVRRGGAWRTPSRRPIARCITYEMHRDETTKRHRFI